MKQNKIIYTIEFMLFSLPILLVLLSTFRSGQVDLTTCHSELKVLLENAFIKDFYTFYINNMCGGVSNIYIDIVLGMSFYILLCMIISLFIDFMCFIPKLAKKWLSRFYD